MQSDFLRACDSFVSLRAEFDEKEDTWQIKRLEFAGNNQKRYKRQVRALKGSSSRPASSRRRPQSARRSSDDSASSGATSYTYYPYFKYDKNSQTGASLVQPREVRRKGMKYPKQSTSKKSARPSTARRKRRSKAEVK